MPVRINLGKRRFAKFNPFFPVTRNHGDADEFDPTSDVPTHGENVECCCGAAPSAEEVYIQNEERPMAGNRSILRSVVDGFLCHLRAWAGEQQYLSPLSEVTEEAPLACQQSHERLRIGSPTKKVRKTSRKYKKGPRKFHEHGRPGTKDPTAKPKALKKRELGAKTLKKHRRTTIRRI